LADDARFQQPRLSRDPFDMRQRTLLFPIGVPTPGIR